MFRATLLKVSAKDQVASVPEASTASSVIVAVCD